MSQQFNDMLTTSRVTFHQLLKTYSIAPPSDPGFVADEPLKMLNNTGATVDRPKIATTTATDARFTGSATASIEMRKIPKAKAAVYVDLNPYPLQTAPGGVKGAEGGNTIYLSVSPAPAANFVPVWFLPWLTGSAIRLTIPARDPHNPSPSIFFTAAINGCSIFIQGTPANPTIFHCGGNTGFAGGQLDEGAVFWQAVMDEFLASDTAEGKNKGGLHAESVDKRDYVSEPGYVKQSTDKATGQIMYNKTTHRAQQFKAELRRKHRFDNLCIEEVSPWGCVLGRRDSAGDWKFYLQENATIHYHQLSSNPFKNMMKTYRKASIAMPMKYRQIFPGGVGHAVIHTPLPKII